MIGIPALAAFMLGLRHGADPDHLAAIDNVTRNSYERTPVLSWFVGAIFASGHSVMVLSISAIVGSIGSRFAAHGALLETIGTCISIVVLVVMGAFNLQQLLAGRYTDGIRGVKTQLLPRALREGTSVWLALPIGLLFGFGFETSSQIAALALSIGGDNGPLGGVLVGAMFCLGMIVTDTLDSLIVHRLISYRGGRLPRIMRVWLGSLTALAFAVAAFETAQVLGWQSPVDDLAVSGALVVTICFVFLCVLQESRRSALPKTSYTSASGETIR
jgi:high-affinity nickel-transport protein